MVEKAKLMKEAQKHVSKGNLDKAIVVWNEIAAAAPDGNTFNTIGDLHVKKGDKSGAIAEYHKAADMYIEEGFALKALAIHKKVLNINPKDPGALIALGKLNEEKNIITDAIKYYLAAADVLAKDNKNEELFDVFEKIISLAPTNIKLRVKVSELYSREGFIAEATTEYCNIANMYIEKNEFAGAEEYLAKAIDIMPGNKDVLLALSDLAEKKGDNAGADEYLQTAIERLGEDADILTRRARLLTASGSIEEASDMLAKVIALDPSNIDARTHLSELHQQAGDITAAWEESKLIIDALIAAERAEDAIAVLNTFKEFEPVDNRRKLITLYKLASDEDNAFAELYDLHEVHVNQGQVDAAITCLKEADDLKPGDNLVQDSLKELEAMVAPPEPTTAPEPEIQASPDVETEPAAAASDGPAAEKTVEDALSEADVFMKYSLLEDARNLLEDMKGHHPKHIELNRKLKEVYREAGDKELAVTQCLLLNSLMKEQGDDASAEAEVRDALSIDSTDARLADFADGASPPAEDLDSIVSEADFYVQQGLYGDAADSYRKALSLSPGNEDIIVKLAEAQKQLNAPPEPVASPSAPEIKPFMGEEAETDGLFDFDSILGDAEEDGPRIDDLDEDVLSIFDEFKKGLAQEISEEDSSTHYDLGIAYKEMGVVDDAIKEFQVSARDPKFFTAATTMIGICEMAVGRHNKAVDAFSAALMKTKAKDDMWWSLKYDLATAYELGGNLKEAFEIYSNVYTWDVTFRDVAQKYESLGGGAPAPAASTDITPEPDDPKSNGKKSRVSYI